MRVFRKAIDYKRNIYKSVASQCFRKLAWKYDFKIVQFTSACI